MSLFALCIASQVDDLYNSALELLNQLPEKYHNYNPIYTQENIVDGVHIPQYDLSKQNYDTPYIYKPQEEALDALSLLQQAAEAGSSNAASALGDIYTFGNFSIPVNYTRALSYYHQAVASKAHGHAYFMLGFMYSTGMFGEIPMNKQRAAVYYDFAAKNNNFNAILVLANKYYHGIDCAVNWPVAKFYYSTAARMTRAIIAPNDLEMIADYITYDIALPDYNGGVYGRRVSESPSSLENRMTIFKDLRESLRDNNLNSQDANIVDYYFDAYESFYGSHFQQRNFTESFQNCLSCVVHASKKFDGPYRDLTTQIDRFIWSRCLSLLARFYFDGRGVQRNVTKGRLWLQQAKSLYKDQDTLVNFAAFHRLDPSYKNSYTSQALMYLKHAATNGSYLAAYLLGVATIAPTQPLQTSYTKNSYDLIKYAAKSDYTSALFYLADAAESGFSATMGDNYECEHIAGFFKSFIEKSEKVMLPHIQYAFTEFRFGNYKNALLGFLIAAEQGLANSQVSAAYLLHQLEPILSWKKKSFHKSRILSAFSYLELASSQDHLDATILLGDLYSKGFKTANISEDYSKAFAYYSKAALSASGHGCYKLGYMYEYGLGSPNNTVDYFMAKRYYDMSRKHYKDRDASQENSATRASTLPVTLALLRLRFKMIFSGSTNEKEMESLGWFSTFKKIATKEAKETKESAAQVKSQAHAEGSHYEGEDEYETFDYVILTLTIAFFLYMAVENLRGRFRRMDRRQNGGDQQDGNAEQAPRFRVEFFFAI